MMKTRLSSLLVGLLVMAGVRVAGQGTAFTYQGQLSDSGSPANGNYNLQFYLRDALVAGNPVGVTNTLAPVAVSNGLFTVTLDFGTNIFDGSARWLEIGVRTNGSGGAFTTLAPRQPVTPTPYAVYAANAGSAAAALLATNATTANGVAPNAVTGAGIQDAAITSAKLADNSVTPGKLSAAGATAGQILRFDGTQWALATESGLAYSAGAGLALTGTTFNVTFAGSGSTTTASRSDHDHLGGFWIGSGGLSVWNTNGPGPFGSSVSLNGFSLADGTGVRGSSSSGTGMFGSSTSGTGVEGDSDSGYGVSGFVSSGTTNAGVYGKSIAMNGSGVLGQADLGANGYGVWGKAAQGKGVVGQSSSGYGVYGTTSASSGQVNVAGVYGKSTSTNGNGVIGEANSGPDARGVWGFSDSGTGVYGSSSAVPGNGVVGKVIFAQSNGVMGQSSGENGHGVDAEATGTGAIGLYASGPTGVQAWGSPAIDAWGIDPATGQFGVAARFAGEVDCGVIKASAISGTSLNISGSKNFKIDHPLDPANKYLYHASIESSEVLNLYSGNVTLDAAGKAVVQLPDWFSALNADFRYQLTSIGAPGPGLYVAEEISNNHFTIAGGKPGTKVSWQVTGARQDPYIKAHPMTLEEEKVGTERGKYLYPEGYGLTAADGLNPTDLAKTRPAHSPTGFPAEPHKTSEARQTIGD